MKSLRLVALLMSGFMWTTALVADESPKPFQNGQKIVFYGDSITHGGMYEYYVQLFYATRFPGRKITVINAGVSGDTAAGGLFRLAPDVLVHKPDLVYMMFGMNDVGRGYYKTSTADEKTKAAREGRLAEYKSSMAENIRRIKDSGASVVVVTPSPYDQYSSSAKSENLAACNDGLGKCAAIGRELAGGAKQSVAELYAPMTELIAANPELKLCGDDRVHPSPAGHMTMAYFILKSQQISGIVARVSIDYAGKQVLAAENCRIDKINTKQNSLVFSYHAEALPFPVCQEYKDSAKIVPWETLNQEIVQIKNLPAGNYLLKCGGKDAGRFSAEQFAAGVNIAGLPTMQQQKSQQLLAAVINVANAARPLRDIAQLNTMLFKNKINPDDFKAADQYLDAFLANIAKYSPSNLKYNTVVVQRYRENRAKQPELLKKAADTQAEFYRLQTIEPYQMEIIR